ncbi:hypothetical protein LJK88_08780 [Paenibacillus sp. P26]|nr:hypothetical protein LJK88_08780 [Paenibacillus sp. P26]
MIFGALRDFERNRGQYGEAVRRALGFVAGLDIREMPATLEIDGKRLFVMKQNPAAAPFEEQDLPRFTRSTPTSTWWRKGKNGRASLRRPAMPKP